MRLLLVTDSDLSEGTPVGGAETSLLLLARSLVAEGHRVTVLFSHDRRTINPLPSVAAVDGVRNVGLRAEPRSGTSLVLRVLVRVGLHRRSRQFVIRMLVARTDAIYSDYRLKAMEWIADARTRSRRPAPWVVRMAGLYPVVVCAERPERRQRYAAAFAQVTALNFLHPASQRLFETRSASVGLELPTSRSFVWDIGSAADVVEAVDRPLRDGPLRLVMVGRFSVYQKRQDLLVEALARVRCDATLTFIGQGPRRAAIEAAAVRHGVRDRVEFLDQVAQGELWDLLGGFDLHCVATDFEGIGKAILESMAVGLPVLVSRVAPLDELITDEVDGFLVDNDPASWAEAIDRSDQDRAALNGVVGAARAMVRDRFDPGRRVREFVEIVQHIEDPDAAPRTSAAEGSE